MVTANGNVTNGYLRDFLSQITNIDAHWLVVDHIPLERARSLFEKAGVELNS
jgi:hypothetical protein